MNVSQLETQTVKKVSMRIIPFLFICFAVSILDRVNVGFAALQMNQELGFSSAVYGLGAGIFFLGYFLLEVPGGIIMTKVGARVWISRIMISWGLISGFTAFVTTPNEFYLVRFLLGVSEASFFPCMAWYLSSWYQSKHHAKAIAAFMVAIPGASALGSPISTWLLSLGWLGLSGWKWLFILEAIPSVILGVIAYYYLTDKIEDAKWLQADERKWLLDITNKEQLLKQEKKHYTLMQAFADRDVLILSTGYFAWMCGYYGIVMFLPTLVKKLSTAMSLQTIGLSIGLMYFFAMVVMVLVGRNSDRLNERRYHVAACLTVSALGLAGSVYFSNSNVITSMVIYAVALAGAYGAYSPFWSIPSSFLTGAAAAGAIAMINSIGNLGGFVGPYAMGYVSQATGSYDNGVLFLSACMIVGATIIAFFIKQSGKALHADKEIEIVNESTSI